MSKFVTIGEMVFSRENVVRFQRTDRFVDEHLSVPHLFVWLVDNAGCQLSQPMICPDHTGELFAKLQRAMEAE